MYSYGSWSVHFLQSPYIYILSFKRIREVMTVFENVKDFAQRDDNRATKIPQCFFENSKTEELKMGRKMSKYCEEYTHSKDPGINHDWVQYPLVKERKSLDYRQNQVRPLSVYMT